MLPQPSTIPRKSFPHPLYPLLNADKSASVFFPSKGQVKGLEVKNTNYCLCHLIWLRPEIRDIIPSHSHRKWYVRVPGFLLLLWREEKTERTENWRRAVGLEKGFNQLSVMFAFYWTHGPMDWRKAKSSSGEANSTSPSVSPFFDCCPPTPLCRR